MQYVPIMSYGTLLDREFRNAAEKAEAMFLKDEKKSQEALATIKPFLKKNPYCIPLLQLKAGILRKIGKIKEADEVRQSWVGVMDSVMVSGDGRSLQTAMHVISTVEEYDVLSMREWKLVMQSIVSDKGHFYDRMTVRDATQSDSAPFDIYFNIDIPYQWLGKLYKN